MRKETKRVKQHRRQVRVRAKISGSVKRPRLSVFRSNKHIYVQLIDDDKGKTLIAVSDKGLKGRGVELSKQVGMLAAVKAKELKIAEVVFDRGKYKYHGNVKAVAEGAREGGLKF